MTPPTVSVVGSTELEDLLPVLVELLRESVNGGASLGFLPPLPHEEARRYWLSLGPELRGGTRLLFIAWLADRVAGTAQLALPSWPTARHRAELNKVMVATALRGHGIGRRLLQAVHDTAWQRNRSLLVLNTRRGDPAEAFYERLGYREAGVIPGYMIGPEGEACDNVAMYRPLRVEWDAGDAPGVARYEGAR
ncbi:MAG: GNAT family N-acetyltransferase [Gemmatimonadales bacterium]